MKYLIVGANGGIATGMIDYLLSAGHEVIAISRAGSEELKLKADAQPTLQLLDIDIFDEQNPLVNVIQQHKPDVIYNTIGMLHSDAGQPEKNIKQINTAFFHKNMEVNCYSAILCAQAIEQTYQRKDTVKFLTISAAVGSISNNTLGGWHSYRMSKAALNMFIKTLSIEWKRNLPKACCVAVYPGTTPSTLSKPFISRVPAEKLFDADITGERMITIAERVDAQNSGEFIHWDNSIIAW